MGRGMSILDVTKPWGRIPAVLVSAGVSTEQVALIPRCAECGERWLPDDEDRWQAHFDADDVLLFLCPECAEREFDN
jgi:hypothetical protein